MKARPSSGQILSASGILPKPNKSSETIISKYSAYIPGITYCSILVGAVYAFREATDFTIIGPLVISAILGIACRSLFGPLPSTVSGIRFCQKPLLRFAVILLGIQLTFTDVLSLGGAGAAAIAISVAATFCFTLAIGKWMNIDRPIRQLIAGGVSICGASAILATNSVAKGSEEDVTYAVACITLLGTVLMSVAPLTVQWFGLSNETYGLWAGITLHEVAQVIGAGFSVNEDAGQYATISKLSRVILLAPIVAGLCLYMSRTRSCEGTDSRTPLLANVPTFLYGFILMIAVASFVEPSAEIKSVTMTLTTIFLSLALAALGLETDIKRLMEKGIKPFILATISTVFLIIVSYKLIILFGL